MDRTNWKFLTPTKGIPFELVIRSLCDVKVLKFDLNSDANQKLLNLIVKASKDTCEKVQSNPIERSRPNEVGNDIEPFVMNALKNLGLTAGRPSARSGRGKSTGYPDVRIESCDYPVYLEVKTFAAANKSTTQRSFYLSPSGAPKVTEDAYHLLVGFEIEREGNLYRPVAFEIVELYGLKCDMKSEFNSDNKRLYEEGRILATGRV